MSSPENRLEGRKPGAIFKMIVRNELTAEELETAFGFAYPDTMLDEENENHVAFMESVAEAKEALVDRAAEAREAAKQELLKTAREHLESMEIDHTVLPEHVLLQIGQSVVAAGEPSAPDEDETEPVYLDEDIGAYVTDQGVIIGWPSIAKDDRVGALKKVGEKYSEFTAKKVGILAEKAMRIEHIVAAYDWNLRQCDAVLNSLEWCFGPMGEQYLTDFIKGQGGKKKPKKSVFVGLLHLAYRAKQATLDFFEPILAADYIEEHFPDAVKRVPKIYIGMIPNADYKKIADEAEGVNYVPGFEKFKMGMGASKASSTSVAVAEPEDEE